MTDADVDDGFTKVDGLTFWSVDGESEAGTNKMESIMAGIKTFQGAGESEVLSCNGMDGVDGFGILQCVREVLQGDKTLKAQFVVVKNVRLKVKVITVSDMMQVDLVRKYEGDAVKFWFEFGQEGNKTITSRKQMVAAKVTCFVFEESEKMGLVSVQGVGSTLMELMIPCLPASFEALAERLKAAQELVVEGMAMHASVPKKAQSVKYMLVQKFMTVEEDFSIGENILHNLEDWRQLTPMRHAETGKPLFSDITNLAILASTLFTRKGVPALNTVFFGPSGAGKTSVLRFWVVNVLRGEFESATASTGKGWLVSHKEGAPPSKMFIEKTCLLVDEMFKAATLSGARGNTGYAITIKEFMQKHMQILDHDEVDASSGNMKVHGRMVCSFVATENPDDAIKHALGKVSCIGEAAMKRVQIAYVEREMDEDETNVNKEQAMKKMFSHLCKEFGSKDAAKEIRALFLYSRRFTEDVSLEPPVAWRVAVKKEILGRCVSPLGSSLGYPGWFGEGGDEVLKTELAVYVKKELKLMEDALSAVWISTGVIRGWEVYPIYDALRPVFDDRQDAMAKALFEYFFQSRLRIFGEGVKQYFESRDEHIERTAYGGG